jgi:hypothetical protein
MKKLADYGIDDHPADDPERAQVNWIVAVLDDCEECEDPRVEITFEEAGRPGTGLVGHLSPDSAPVAPRSRPAARSARIPVRDVLAGPGGSRRRTR